MQREQARDTPGQRGTEGGQVLGALGQHEHLTALRIGVDDVCRDGCGAPGILRKRPRHPLDTGLSGQCRGNAHVAGYPLQGLRST